MSLEQQLLLLPELMICWYIILLGIDSGFNDRGIFKFLADKSHPIRYTVFLVILTLSVIASVIMFVMACFDLFLFDEFTFFFTIISISTAGGLGNYLIRL